LSITAIFVDVFFIIFQTYNTFWPQGVIADISNKNTYRKLLIYKRETSMKNEI